MEVLSITAITIQDTLEKIEPILLQANASDPRYDGMYLLDSTGNVLIGAGTTNGTHLSKQAYIQEVIHTKDTIISNQIETLINGHHVIGIAKPVLDENQNFLLNYYNLFKCGLHAKYIKNDDARRAPYYHKCE